MQLSTRLFEQLGLRFHSPLVIRGYCYDSFPKFHPTLKCLVLPLNVCDNDKRNMMGVVRAWELSSNSQEKCCNQFLLLIYVHSVPNSTSVNVNRNPALDTLQLEFCQQRTALASASVMFEYE